ncbi:MAG: hypothetical protein CL677_10640 [Bdellovibrionaceae bacterium]|nr:hypothetical protein [Pseudobdellovibrionaceae bacterium]|tara:strand:- start:39697 stop:40671 length:975 start_codon:yes stop_codon:yes gene_type:complete
MKLTLSVPSKTFLIGEYLALFGGPSLVANTGPRFSADFNLKGRGKWGRIHPDSPAGQWIQHNLDVFEDVDIDFKDPYAGAGGLGGSSAEFVMVYVFAELVRQKLGEGIKQLNPQKMWIDYRSLFETSQQEWLPSGADIIGQMVGGITEFEPDPFRIKKHTWNFENISFVILKTENKVKTHEHLRDLGELDTDNFKAIAKQAVNAMNDSDQLLFVKSIEQYQSLLQEQKLVCRETVSLVNNLKGSDNIIGVKGCGALGADTLLVLCEKGNVDRVQSMAPVVGLKYVASDQDLGGGLKVEFDYAFNRQQQAIQTKFINDEQRLDIR